MANHTVVIVCYIVSLHWFGNVSFADTAYAENNNSGKWYNFDDSHVTECSDKSIVVSDDTS